MERNLLSSPPSVAPAEAPSAERQCCPEAEALAEARKTIVADCRIAPEEYLEEVRVAASGE